VTMASPPATGTVSGHLAQFHWRRLLIGAIVFGATLVLLRLLGWNVRDWLSQLWDTVKAISPAYLLAAVVLQTLQTVFTAMAWMAILRYAYPQAAVTKLAILACYATSTALNGFLPANLGTLVMLLMFVAVIVPATFAGVFAGYLIHKIFFTVIGAFVYVYLFVSVSGSFDIKLSFVHEHPAATVLVAVGAVVLVVVLVGSFWPRLRGLWEQAKRGGGIITDRRAYLRGVFLPELLGWIAKLGVIAVCLAAYSIPVSFHTVMRVVGGNSIANVASVTPGGVGVNQAFNVASLNGVTDAKTATAYSVGQQLITTVWNIAFAVVLLVWAFGWSGGRQLVATSYTGAKEKARERGSAQTSENAESA
jgi:uncharacterized membrane protein YbhN (UPF0104 family)